MHHPRGHSFDVYLHCFLLMRSLTGRRDPLGEHWQFLLKYIEGKSQTELFQKVLGKSMLLLVMVPAVKQELVCLPDISVRLRNSCSSEEHIRYTLIHITTCLKSRTRAWTSLSQQAQPTESAQYQPAMQAGCYWHSGKDPDMWLPYSSLGSAGLSQTS